MKYILMNKNREITSFTLETNYGCDYEAKNVAKCKKSDLPYGNNLKTENSDIERCLSAWLSNRNGAPHNRMADYVVGALGLFNHDSFIRCTHATSLNDTFWVRAEDEKISWEDVSLYRHKYNELVGRACLGDKEGMDAIKKLGRFDKDNIHTDYLPEILHHGSFPRIFEKTDEGIYIYKADGSAQNSYCEKLASEVSEIISGEYHVPYTIDKRYGKSVSGCRIFTDEDTGLVTYYVYTNAAFPSSDGMLNLCKDLGCEEAYRRMLVFDALIFNTDRHLNNFGFLMDNETLKIKGFAPYYDQNLSLFGNLSEDDFKHPDRHVYYRHPRFDQDFTIQGQKMVTEKIASDVEKFLNFSFEFRGDEHFPEYMVEGTEKIIRLQAKALLDKSLTSETAFISQKSKDEQMQEKYDRALFRAKSIKRIVFPEDGEYVADIKEDKENYRLLIEVSDKEETGTMTIDMMGLNISESGKQFDMAVTEKVSSLINGFLGHDAEEVA